MFGHFIHLRSIRALWLPALLVGVVLVMTAGAHAAEETVSFRNDVMPVLAKAGCNAGACHGNKSGKGGLKLSLRGQDPAIDFDTLTRDLFGRRVNTIEPEQSLLLLKATGQIPHEGGQRFTRESTEYQIVLEWIAGGAARDAGGLPQVTKLDVTPADRVVPAGEDSVALKAVAHLSDGSTRDVTQLAVYEQAAEVAKISHDGVVTLPKTRARPAETTVIVSFLGRQSTVRLTFVPDRPGFAWAGPEPKNVVDREVFAKLKTLKINPSPGASEVEFVRRAYMDLLGLLPTPEEAQAFFDDTSADKKARLIDQLLDRPEYAEAWALKWADLLRVEERTLDRKGVKAFYGWIRESMARNKPMDQFARELVAGRGSTYQNPPANYYRATRDPVTRAETTAAVFLGTRLQCAQCHNHPFDRWTQDDYYDWADVFSRVDYKIIENNRKDKNDSHEFDGEQIVLEKSDGNFKDPRPGRAVKPRFLGSGEGVKPDASRLDGLAEWITSPRSPLFARAQVNRIWAQLMGRGLVDPVDDFRATNPASHPALLDKLAKEFAENGYDARRIIKLIMLSETYARSAEINETNADDEVNYARAIPRRLTAEQLLDAQHQVMGLPAQFTGYPLGMRAGQIPGVAPTGGRRGRPTEAEMFLTTFGKPPRLLACDCERNNDATLGQTFQMTSGPGLAALLANPDNRIGRLMKDGRSDREIIEALYRAALTRGPSEEERAAAETHVKEAKDRRAALEDIAWAVLNAKELVMRR